MRKWIVSLVLFCALTVGVFVLIANVLGNTTLEIDKSSWQKVSNIKSYNIVYSNETEGFSDFKNSAYFENNPAKQLAAGLMNKNKDWNLNVVEADKDDQKGNTIYVCNTSLDKNAKDRLKDNDFTIRFNAGVIRIEGKTNNAILAGVNFFLRECVIKSADGINEIFVPTGSGYHYNYISNSIAGVDISKFYIVVDDTNGWGIVESAQKIQQRICEISNVFLPIVSDTQKVNKNDAGVYEGDAGKYEDGRNYEEITPIEQSNQEIMKNYTYPNEIYISGSTSLRSDAIEIIENLNESEYFVGVKNGKLLILGEDALAVREGVNYFIKRLNSIKKGWSIRLSSDKLSASGVAKYSKNLNIYVDAQNGNNTGDAETKGLSEATAVKTLAEAINIFNSKMDDSEFSNNFVKVNINILNGSYDANNLKIEVPENIRLNITNYKGSSPIIESLKEIKPTKDSAGYYSYTFNQNSENAFPNIRQLYVTQNNITTMATMAESKVFTTDGNSLYYTVAEVQGKIEGVDNEIDTNNKTYTKYPVDVVNKRIYVDSSVYETLSKKDITGCEEIWLEGQWQSFNLKIKGVGMEQLIFTNENGSSQKKYCYYVVAKDDNQFYNMYNAMLHISNGKRITRGFSNRSYSIKNSLAYIKTGNNYVYDNTTGTVYFKSDTASKKIEYAQNKVLFDVSNSYNITFNGLTFTGVEYKGIVQKGAIFGQAGRVGGETPDCAAIYGTNTTNITVKNCVFKEINSNAIQLKGRVLNLSIEGNKFNNIGMSAIIVGHNGKAITYARWKEIAVKNLTIKNNLLTNIASLYPAYCAILITKGDGIKILHNEIDKTSYTAISVGWGWSWNDIKYNYLECFNVNRADIAYNKITNFMQVLKDGGAIYTLGANCQKEYTNYFNKIHDNYAYNDNVRDSASIYIYYLDGASSNWEVYNNVAGGGTYGMYSQFISGQETHNNYMHDLYIIKDTTKTPIKITGSEPAKPNVRNVKSGQDLLATVSYTNETVVNIREASGIEETEDVKSK